LMLWIFTLWVSFGRQVFHHFNLVFSIKAALFQLLTADSRMIG
jgi:hypothetical protein